MESGLRVDLVLLATTALAAMVAVGCAADDSGGLYVRSYEFDSANVAVHDVGGPWTDAAPALVNAGVRPNTAEYRIVFPVSAEYAIWVKYAAAETRPVDFYMDDRPVGRGADGVTGGWQTSTAAWQRLGAVDLEAGEHTFRFVCAGDCIPHIVAYRFETDAAFPEGFRRRPKPLPATMTTAWSGSPEPGKYDFEAYVREDGFVDAPPDYNPILPYEPVPAPAPRAERVLEYLLMGDGAPDVRAEILPPDEWEPDAVAVLSVTLEGGRAIEETLPLGTERIAKMLEHCEFLLDRFEEMGAARSAPDRDRVADLKKRLDQVSDDGSPERWQRIYELYVDAYRLKNRIALSNPLLDFDELLFAKRQTYDTSHIYTTYFDGSHRYGGNLYVLSGLGPTGQTRPIVSGLPEPAIYRDPDLSWDGAKALFSYKPDLATPCHIYEVNLDGSGLRQLTDGEYDDIDPCYLPDGRIMFVSTRCRRVVLCSDRYTVSVLYTMDADGGDVRCVSRNTVNDFTPSVLADGRVVYTKWEYVDKHLGNNQALWTVRPDGGAAEHVCGANWGPITLWEPRGIPGSSLIVTTLAPHMPLAVGPIALVDPADRGKSPAVYENLTPEIPPPHHFGWHRPSMGYYGNPFPLSEDFFLVSYAYGPGDREPTGYGLYLLDRWNNRDLIYRDPTTSCFEALPVRARPVPPTYATPAPRPDAEGVFVLMNVYDGLEGVEPGAVKHLRIVEELPKPVSAPVGSWRLQYPAISNQGHHAVKRILGTVPVEADGSAHFRAPAGKALYFSALDERRMEIQRMRSYTDLEPGEVHSCVGCHEPRTTAPQNTLTLAMRRPASEIAPPVDGVHAADFHYDVQPVLDRHCVSCHGRDDPAGGVSLVGDRTNLFSVAYESLTNGGYVSCVDIHRSDTLPLRGPMYYGSHASKLIDALDTTHAEWVDMPDEDFERLVTWIDCNAPYYGTYVYSRPGTLGGRELLTPTTRGALQPIFDRRCASCHAGDVGRIHRIRFEEPERSPAVLAPLAASAGGSGRCGDVFADRDDPDAVALLAVMEQLKREIAENPREDMLAERPPVQDPECRYVCRPEE